METKLMESDEFLILGSIKDLFILPSTNTRKYTLDNSNATIDQYNNGYINQFFHNGPFGFFYKYHDNSVSKSINTRKFFVFSYFCGISNLTQERPLNQDDKNKIYKYIFTPIKKIKTNILDSKFWRDFGVIVFLDRTMATAIIPNQIIIEYNNKNTDKIKFHSTKQYTSARQLFILNLTHINKVILFDVLNDSDTYNVYSITAARFAALCINNIEEVCFRDAHSTMPNNQTGIDRKWHDHWIITRKRFFSYQMVNYNANHNKNRTTMFAGTWSARSIDNEIIITLEEWNNLFETGIERAIKQQYGIDEQLLIPFTRSELFKNQMYIVGITHIIWIFLNKINFTQWSSLFHNGKTTGKFKEIDDIKEQDYTNIKSSVYIDINESGNITETYFSEIKCIFKYINKIYYKTCNSYPSLNKLFDTINNFKKISKNKSDNYTPELKMYHSSYNKILNLIPSRWHFWSFIFE